MPTSRTDVDVYTDASKITVTPVQQAEASCVGAIITSLLVTPLDVVKIRLQSQQKAAGQSKCFLYCNGLMDHLCTCGPEDSKGNGWYRRPGQFTGTLDAFIKISRNEGITSLWSGLSPTLVLALPATVVYFVSYEQLRLKLNEIYNEGTPQNETCQPYWVPLVSGGTARIISCTLVSPLELVRTKMQSQKLSYLEIGDALKLLIKQNGIRGLWKGIFPTLLRDVPFSAVYWTTYETYKSIYVKPNTLPTFWTSFSGGAISGMIAAALTVPFDVVKTHQQVAFGEGNLYEEKPSKSKSGLQISKEIYSDHGVKGLFAGIVPRLIKVAPACAIMISSFEYGKVFFNRLANKRFPIQLDDSSILHKVTVNKTVSHLADKELLDIDSPSRDTLS